MDSPTRWAVYLSSTTCSLQKVHFLKCETWEVGFSRLEMQLRSFLFFSFFLFLLPFFFIGHGCLKGLCNSCQVHFLNFAIYASFSTMKLNVSQEITGINKYASKAFCQTTKMNFEKLFG